jgi:hypothetical protein
MGKNGTESGRPHTRITMRIAELEDVTRARRLTCATLAAFKLGCDYDSLELLVSELAANVAQHGGGGGCHEEVFVDGGPRVKLTFSQNGELPEDCGEVVDLDEILAGDAGMAWTDEDGRGLLLVTVMVRALGAEWRVHPEHGVNEVEIPLVSRRTSAAGRNE